MIDYVKILINQPNRHKLLESDKLDFKGAYSKTTGEFKEDKLISEYHFCKITIYDSGRVYFSGSIHKMWNSINGVTAPNYDKSKTYRGYNGNSYKLQQVEESIKIISQLLFCEPQQMIFQNIEIGVNTTPSFDPQLFIKGLIMHYGKGFEYKYFGRYAQATHERYYLKIYNKSHQYGIEAHTLRIELKIRKMEDLKSTGLQTMADINSSTLGNCKELLLKQFEKVVYYDYTIRKEEIKKSLKSKLKDFSNNKYWQYDLPPNRRHRPKKKLNEIIRDHSENLKAILRCQIIEKCVIINQQSETPKCVIINHSNIEADITQVTPRICPVTREDISMQKEGSFLLSNTGFKHLEKSNPNKFKTMEKNILTGMPNKFETDKYSRLAKQIRNRYFNNRPNPQQLKLL
jgi:hypothetical protein